MTGGVSIFVAKAVSIHGVQLMAEEQMRILNDKNYKANLDKILQRYADCDDVMEFCSTYAP